MNGKIFGAYSATVVYPTTDVPMSKFHSANISVTVRPSAGFSAEIIGTGYKLNLGARSSINPIAVLKYTSITSVDRFKVQWNVSGTMYTIK